MKQLPNETKIQLRELLAKEPVQTAKQLLEEMCPVVMSGDPSNYKIEAIAVQAAKAEGYREAIYNLFVAIPKGELVSETSPYLETNKD